MSSESDAIDCAKDVEITPAELPVSSAGSEPAAGKLTVETPQDKIAGEEDIEMEDLQLPSVKDDEPMLVDDDDEIEPRDSSQGNPTETPSEEVADIIKKDVVSSERKDSIDSADTSQAVEASVDQLAIASESEQVQESIPKDLDCSEISETKEADSSIEIIGSPLAEEASTEDVDLTSEEVPESKLKPVHSIDISEDIEAIASPSLAEAKVDDSAIESITDDLATEQESNLKDLSEKSSPDDLDSSIELIESPIEAIADESPSKELTSDGSNLKNVDSSSIEIIESPVEAIESIDDCAEEEESPSKELAAEESTHKASDSSIELIESPDKANVDDKTEDCSKELAIEEDKTEASSDESKIEEEPPIEENPVEEQTTIESEKNEIANKDISNSESETIAEATQTKETIDETIADEETKEKSIEKNDDVAGDLDLCVKSIEEASSVATENLKTEEAESEKEAVKMEEMETDEIKSETDEFFAELKEVAAPKLEEPKAEPNQELRTASDVFYNKDCLNCNCKKESKQYLLTSVAALNYFKVPRKTNKRQFVCMGCFDFVLDVYEEYAALLLAKQPLLLREFKHEHAVFVALDSSDEEEDANETETPEFSSNDLNLIENELENAIKNVLGKVEIQNQLAWSKTILESKTQRLERQFELADAELSKLQNMADKMHFALYNSCQVVHKHLQPLDIYPHSGLDYAHVPPAGEIEHPPIQMQTMYFAVKNKAIASWVPVRVVELTESNTVGGNMVRSYKIRYLNTPYQMIKTVTAKHLAYFQAPPVRLTIGTRVIAFFDGTTLSRRGKEKGGVQSAFYPGIIAEPLKQANRFRYLIFYDDGYTQYVQHKDVRLVCLASDKVWEDVHPASRDFIQKYVEKYSVDRPMVQCTRGQSMNTESNGTWLYARVIDIDCSLVLMQFEGDKNHTEWIYRGSLRLGPVFKETQNALNSANSQQMRVPRRTEPFIRYTKEMETSNQQVNQQMRAIARKSSSQPPTSALPSTSATAAALAAQSSAAAAAAQAATASRNAVRHLNNSTIYVDDENRPKGHVVYFTAKRNLPPKVFTQHECTPNCLFKIVHRLDSYSPLAKPLLSGWERLVMRQKIKRCVVYRGPCGKSLRDLSEVHAYLRVTENVLNVENFDFTPELCCLAEYSIDPTIVKEADISKGQEKMAIPLVNYYDNTLPPPCTYAAQRIPTEGVDLNLDEEFLVGCDCDDDCSDKSRCACWQLTVGGVKYCNPTKPIDEIGYQYKRLHEHVPTGIYECNSRCKCKKNCLNRVVQHSLEMKLQVFKTSNRGWGLRCVNDIPKGAFICIYAGHLLTETCANEGGLDAGDEYFADLDYIEVAEQLKEGFESDVDHSDMEEDTYMPDAEDDDDFTPQKHYQPRQKNKLRAVRSNSSHGSSEADSQERAVINFNPNADMDETVRENSVRRLFGKDEAPYIMDAKTTGNLGRYFNHSCAPNLFVQNVFVDTHDLRFPWVAFFSANHIRSGTELTWNYNYEVGVVPGKVLYCQCGAANCRIRLL